MPTPTSRVLDFNNRIFPHFEVIGKSNSRDKWGSVLWYCQCECGDIFIAKAEKLKKNYIKSCGCIRRSSDRLPDGISAFHRLCRSYTRKAKDRKLEFLLSIDFIYTVTQENCHYCGAKPSNIVKSDNNTGDYVYNGMDRIDNSIGYIEDNVVPCCKICNGMKSALNYQSFLAQCKAIAINKDL